MDTLELIAELEKTAADLNAAADRCEAEKVASANAPVSNSDPGAGAAFVAGMASALGLR